MLFSETDLTLYRGEQYPAKPVVTWPRYGRIAGEFNSGEVPEGRLGCDFPWNAAQ
jgi:hypothetical protein